MQFRLRLEHSDPISLISDSNFVACNRNIRYIGIYSKSQLSLPYNWISLTQALNILSLVCLDICEFLPFAEPIIYVGSCGAICWLYSTKIAEVIRVFEWLVGYGLFFSWCLPQFLHGASNFPNLPTLSA